MPKKILIVDDNQQVRSIMRKVLEAGGYQVLEAHDGRSAVESMAQGPDLVIQDLILPDISGYDLVAKIRAKSADKALPVLALSGFLAQPNTPWDTSHGFNELLVKPVPNLQLLEAVKKYLPDQ